ncbi:MAG: UPF0182 family protein, partial [Candidatus Methylomirabilales bacterium]
MLGRLSFRLILLLLVAATFLLSAEALSLLTDWLWFGEVGYRGVFLRILTAKAALGVLLGTLFFAAVYG